MSEQTGELRLDDQLCFALYAAAHAVMRAYRPLLSALGLTYPQYLVMLVLWQDGARPVREIAARLQLGPSAITPLIDQLEASGLVLRCRSTTDRRVVAIVPTPAGQRLESAASEVQQTVVCRTGLAADALAALRLDLTTLVATLADRTAALYAVPEHEPA